VLREEERAPPFMYGHPREEERGPDPNFERRRQGGGEAPPLYEGLREEERDPHLAGASGPEIWVAADPGRRRGSAAGHVGSREEERTRHFAGAYGP
jgi:hypothetical protein